MDISDLNIYPLNAENLQALLDYRFHFLPRGNVNLFLSEIKGTGITLKDLEYASEKILPYIPLISERIGSEPIQTNILGYAVEIFLFSEFNFKYMSPERLEIVKIIKTKSGINQTYEEMPGKETRIFFYNNWN